MKIANKIIKTDEWVKHAQESKKSTSAPNVNQSASHSSNSQNPSSTTENASKPSQNDDEDEFEDGLL